MAANSITDGQPGPAHLPFFQSNSTYTKDGGFAHNLCVANTFSNQGFWRNSLFSLNILSLTAINNRVDYDKTINPMWQHRWQHEENSKPTIATNISLIVPVDEPDISTEVQTTLIVIKNITAKSVVFFNLTLGKPFEDFSNTVNYSVLLGHKYFLDANHALFTDVVYQESLVTLETAVEFNLPNSMVLSPGINFTVDTDTNEKFFGFGAVILFQTQ